MLEMRLDNPSFFMEIKDVDMKIESARIVYKETETYNGDYVIEPDKDAQTLETKDRRMLDDVSILAVPRHDVSNIDGTTVIIGGVPYYGK